MSYFDFTFNAFSLLPLLTALANLFLLYLLATKAQQTITTRIISIFVLFVVITGFGETLVRNSATPYAADFWQLFNLPLLVSFGPMILSIALVYTGRIKIVTNFLYQILFFGSSFAFLWLGLATPYFQNKDLSNFTHYYYGWNDSGDSLFFWLCIVAMLVMLVYAVILLFSYRKKLTDEIQIKQTNLFIIAFLIPIVAGIIADGIIQNLYGHPVLPLLSISSTSITGIVLSYAILKYKLFVVNPSTIASNILETMNEVLIVLDPKNHILFANEAVGTILKYDKNDLVNQNIKNLIFNDYERFELEVLSPVRKGNGVSSIELNLRSADGESIPVAFSASSILDDKKNLNGIVGVATDLRKIKSLTASIEKTKNRLQAINTIIDTVVSGILVLDLNDRVVLANHSILKILNLKHEDVLNKRLAEILTLKEKGMDLQVESLITVGNVTLKKNNLEIGSKLRQKSPEPIIVDVISTPIANGHEFALSSMLVFQDKTQEVQLEEMKLDFVSMAAHELRTPLTSIQGYVSMLIDDLSPKLTPENRDQLERLSISANNLNSLIENLLNVSRIEKGIFNTEFSPIDMVAVVKKIIESLQNQAIIKKQRIVLLNPDIRLPLVLGDEFRIGEVVQNLIANAINYTKEGGEVTIELYVKDDYVLFKIKDNGLGIPKSAIPNLFTKFFRVGGRLEQGSKGTGLGLYISKSIVNMHKGDIWVESVLGEGSTFYFRLPIPDKSEIEKSSNKRGILQPRKDSGIFINENRFLNSSNKDLIN